MNDRQYRVDCDTPLDYWQPQCCPGLVEESPEKLFNDPEFVQKYRSLHQDLWLRMIHIHGTLHTLDELSEFPFDYIYGPQNMEFWRLVVSNFFDTALLNLCSLLDDSGPDAHTIMKTKNLILKAKWNDNSKRQHLKVYLKDIKFDQRLKSIIKKVKGIRNHRIAHKLISQETCGPAEQLDHVSLKEIWELYHSAQKIFGAISFGSCYVTLSGDLMPTTVGGKPTKTCLETVLDSVLRESHFVNEPEQRGQWWKDLRRHKDQEVLDCMNKCRERIGLEPA